MVGGQILRSSGKRERAEAARQAQPTRPIRPPSSTTIDLPTELEAARQELREALEQQAAVSDVLKAMSRSPYALDELLQATIDRGTTLCRAKDGLIYLMSGDGLRFFATNSGGSPKGSAYELAHPTPIDRTTAVGRAVVEAGTVHIADVLADPEYQWDIQKVVGYRTLLAVPIRGANEILGVITFSRHVVSPFSDREIALVETFANQAGIAIENVRLFNETREALERQTATAEILRAISRSPTDVQPVLDAIATSAVRFCGAEDAVVNLLESGVLSTRAHAGPVPAVPSQFRILQVDRESVTAQVIVDRKTVHIADLQNDPDHSLGREVAASTGFRTTLGAPLLRQGEPIGAIVLRRRTVQPFTPQQIELVEAFASQAVIAIENVRLFNEIRNKSGELEVVNRELATASRRKSEFLANMSHELRTPLNAIIGFSDVLEQRLFGELNDRQADYTRDIASSGRHLLDLVNEILDLSKVEAGRMELDLSEFALAETIRGALAFVRERAARQGISLSADIPADLGTAVADERKVRQVLLNLLSNAVKFTPDGGTIGVRARRAAGEVQVSVSDTGIGIAPEDQAKVFDEFQQVGKASDRSREGTGLGLTLAKRFIELHGGRIRVESAVSKGTIFTFMIPASPAVLARPDLSDQGVSLMHVPSSENAGRAESA